MADNDKNLRTLRDLLIEGGHDKIKVEALTPIDDFIDVLGADSLESIQFAMDIEEKFRIEISDDELDKALTLEAISSLIAAKTSPSQANTQ